VTRDWKAWTRLGVHEIMAPMAFHSRIKLDYPVSLGNYRHARDPSEPMCLHLVHVPGAPNQGHSARDQFRIGRQSLLDTTFDQFEARIRDDLDRMLGPGGFSSGRDIAAITVNRWSHGYAYAPSGLYDGDDFAPTIETARKPAGRVAIANSDAQWNAYAHAAIDEADRAVREVLASQLKSTCYADKEVIMPAKRLKPRLEAPDASLMTAEQRAMCKAIAQGPRKLVKLIGPFGVWLNAPAFGELAQRLGGHCRFRTGVPPRLSEFAIIVTARQWRAQYECRPMRRSPRKPASAPRRSRISAWGACRIRAARRTGDPHVRHGALQDETRQRPHV